MDIFKELVDPEIYSRLKAVYGDNTPAVSSDWDEAVVDRLNEAEAEPMILDSYQYSKALGGRRRSRDKFDARIVDEKAELSRLFNHYARGLLMQYDAAVKLGLHLPAITDSPKAMLGYKFVNHQGLLEFGLSLTTDQPFPQFIVDAAIALLCSRYKDLLQSGWSPAKAGVDLDDYLNVKASYPRGKNSGLPFIVSGTDRLMSNLVLAVNSGLASALVRGFPWQEMFKDMALGYIVYSRFQRTGKPVPATLLGRRVMTKGLEARRRIINSTPKPIAMAVKPLVKWLTVTHLHYPEFRQDRDELRTAITRAADVWATDASRFDLRSGGVKLRQGLDVIKACVTDAFSAVPPAVLDLMYVEAFLPTMVTLDGKDGQQVARWTHKSALRSGASTTSRVGSIINLMYDMVVTANALRTEDVPKIVEYYRQHAPSAIQGDDMLKLFPSQADSDAYREELESLASVGMSVEEEIPTKFLGYLVRPLGQETGPPTGLYHGSNPLENMFFPERFRTYAVASMLSRYVILRLGEAKKVVETLTAISQDANVAMKWYRDFYRDLYPLLEPHYRDHPVGAARVYFSTLLHPDDFTLDRLSSVIKHDEDELLRHIAQTARFELNDYLFGEGEADSENDVDVDENVVTGSLIGFRESFARSLSAGAHDALTKGLDRRWILRDPRVVPLLNLFTLTNDEEYVRAWRSVLPQVGRETRTDFGSIFSANL